MKQYFEILKKHWHHGWNMKNNHFHIFHPLKAFFPKNFMLQNIHPPVIQLFAILLYFYYNISNGNRNKRYKIHLKVISGNFYAQNVKLLKYERNNSC